MSLHIQRHECSRPAANSLPGYVISSLVRLTHPMRANQKRRPFAEPPFSHDAPPGGIYPGNRGQYGQPLKILPTQTLPQLSP